jgi:UDP-N-acetylglucosamine--N-acetylmuramyl-(pentapeptide) pyrophosphoryl-undecaprenol N-acetylglucosamine transferase
LLLDADCDATRLAEVVESLLADPERLVAMGSAAAAAGHRDAVEKIAALVESVSEGCR